MSRLHRAAALCWRLPDGLVYARLVFAESEELEALRPGEAAAVAQLAEELGRPDVEAPADFEEIELRRVSVTVRPSRREGRRTRVDPDELVVPADVVIARRAPGFWACALPAFDVEFGTSDLGELDVVIPHLVRLALQGEDATALLHHLRRPRPSLEVFQFKPFERERAPRERVPARLAAVAERIRRTTPRPPGMPQSAWGRRDEVAKVLEAVEKGENVLLVGEPGVGKSAILHDAVRQAARVRERSFWRTQAHRLVSGARWLGEWQALADTMLAELAEIGGTLWVDDVVALTTVGGGPTASLAAYLRPALAERRFRLVGEATPKGLEALRTLLPGFVELFTLVPVAEMETETARGVLQTYTEQLEAQRQAPWTPEGREAAWHVAVRFLPGERLPGSLVRVVSATAAAHPAAQGPVTAAVVHAAFGRLSGLPHVLLDDQAPLHTDELTAWMEARIKGQPAAVDAVVRVLSLFKTGLEDPRRPIATLLFAGPTGVGKTATAKALADWSFGAGQAQAPLVRVDMSELQHPAQIARLVGGEGEVGELVRRVRERPFGVLLLDEVEKAHPAFFDVLMTVLDEGTLTDRFGRVTDFRRMVVILTTNLGATSRPAAGFGAPPPGYLAEIRRFFRPEFFNRIDQVVPFAPLDAAAIRAIAALELAAVGEREGLKQARIRLHFEDELVERVAAAGFDPTWGARLLQRTVERLVVAAVARHLLEHPGLHDTELIVGWDRGRVVVV